MNHPLKLERYLKNSERLKALLDARDTKVASVHARRKWLQKQQVFNYQNEHNRVRDSINHTLTLTSRAAMEHRLKELKKLGAKAIEGIQ